MLPLNDPPPGPLHSTRLWVGLAIIFLGVLAALDNLRVFQHVSLIRLWPLVLVVMGLTRLGQNKPERGIPGPILIGAGAFLLLLTFGGENLAEFVGPFFIVLLGIFIVTKALQKNRSVPAELASHDNFLSGTAIFGGAKRRPATPGFKGGDMTAIFGGFELDLRSTTLDGETVRVDVFILFGGGEIRVPQGWDVAMKGTTIAGAFEDKTLHLPAPEVLDGVLPPATRPTLVLTGLALFGGLTVTN